MGTKKLTESGKCIFFETLFIVLERAHRGSCNAVIDTTKKIAVSSDALLKVTPCSRTAMARVPLPMAQAAPCSMHTAYIVMELSRVLFTTTAVVVLCGSFLVWTKPTTGALATTCTVKLPLISHICSSGEAYTL